MRRKSPNAAQRTLNIGKAMTFSTVLFYLFALVLVYAAVRVIIAPNPITAVLHLILAFFTAAMSWVLIGAEFLGLLLVLVYVGAVMVLFLFVVMMLDVRMESLREGLRAYMGLGVVVGLIMALEMAFVVASSWLDAGAPAAQAQDFNSARSLGELMYSQYVYAVEIGAVVLLVGMVAAIALTMRQRSDVKRVNPADQVRVKAQDRIRLVKMPAQQKTTAAPNDATRSKDA